MEHGLLEDRLLLQRFVKDNSQEAFAALTARYLNLVYAVCRRELADADTAEDVTQAVFLILARKAPSLGRSVVLSGWLFQTARFAAKNARLREQRRRRYEEKAMERHPQARTEDAEWSDIEPLLNKSLAALKAKDRDSILLRFFQDASFAEVGATLGLSEEAARKRVTRALEKLKHFFGKEEVYLPSSTLASLLTAHAVQIAPAACQTGVAHATAGVIAGHLPLSLIGSPLYHLSEGTLKAMKIAKLKIAAGTTALALLGTTAVFGTAASILLKNFLADSKPSQYRTVALTGKVRFADGTPAGNVHLTAQAQNAYWLKTAMKTAAHGPGSFHAASPGEMEKDSSLAHSKPDGSYTLYVGSGIPYNVCVVPENLIAVGEDDGTVAAAVEGVSGAKGKTVHVADLTLVSGGFVTGTVTEKAGEKPAVGVDIGSYGPERPESSAVIISAVSDSTGHYRLRVAPGSSRVYVSDGRYAGSPEQRVKVAEGQSVSADFQVSPKPPAPTSPPRLYVPPAK